MASKPLDFLNRIPTVSELLEKQPVRALTDRWNRSTVSAGVRSFLDELRTDLRRRAADVPGIRELAERAAQYVVDLQRSTPQTVINATGRMVGAPWAAVPLSDKALERAVITGRDFVATPDAPAPATEISSHICRITGAQAAVAVHSYSGGLWLALAALANDREVLVSRAEVGEVDSAGPLPKLAAAARCLLKDVGTANRTTAADYEAATSPRAKVLLKLNSDEYRIVGDTASAELEELVALARDRELAPGLRARRRPNRRATGIDPMATTVGKSDTWDGRRSCAAARRWTSRRTIVRHPCGPAGFDSEHYLPPALCCLAA